MDELRIGDAERDDALRMLAEHLAAGRLDIDEHSERSSQIISARTRGEIRKLFVDLPEPHPLLGRSPAPGTGRGVPSGQPSPADARLAVRSRKAAAVRTFAAGLTPLVWCICIAVFVMTDVGWWMFLVPIAYSALLSAWEQASGGKHPAKSPEESHDKPHTDPRADNRPNE
ncbi:DUF1707 domain-containing protein [Actinopolymorpha sp. B11F2]|uniref:DUF1707 SHOCT-like domain-containing protein n=1 Tax=Actinopolymorpha sp. B11F2 TaxID=3160862 RepID=UPI0032E4D07D